MRISSSVVGGGGGGGAGGGGRQVGEEGGGGGVGGVVRGDRLVIATLLLGFGYRIVWLSRGGGGPPQHRPLHWLIRRQECRHFYYFFL